MVVSLARGTGSMVLVVFWLATSEARGQVALPPSDLPELVASVSSQQEFLAHLSIDFDAVVTGDPLSRRPINPAPRDVPAKVRWVREFDREMLDVAFDLPNSVRVHPFIDERIFLEPGRMITHFVRTDQVLINAERDFPVIPNPKLILTAGLRCDLAQAQSRGAQISASRHPDGRIAATLMVPWFGDDAEIDVWIDPKLRYSITAWSSDRLNQAATIQWRADEFGQFIPAEVVWSQKRDSDYRWTMRLTRFSTDSASLGDSIFRFQSGMLVADYSDSPAPGSASSYRIGSNGERESILLMHSKPGTVSGEATRTVSAVVAVVVVAVAAIRLRIASRG